MRQGMRGNKKGCAFTARYCEGKKIKNRTKFAMRGMVRQASADVGLLLERM